MHEAPCLQPHWGNDQARYGKMCYSDVPYLYTGRGLDEGRWPYAADAGRYQAMEYPVGITYFAWAAARLTQLHPAGPPIAERRGVPVAEVYGLPGLVQEVDDYFLVTSVLLALCLLGATWFLVGAHRDRPWDALPFVLSPVLLLTGLVNWDLLAVLFVAGALWGWSRGRPVLTGVMIGLGAATKLYPLLLLGPVLVVAWRRRQPATFVRALGGAVASWVLVNLPALLTGYHRWTVFWTFNRARGADLGSVWLWLSDHGHAVSVSTINLWSWGFLAAICLGVLVLGLLAPEPPRLAQLGVLVVAGFLLVNKVYSPQYVLWLLPLAVMARPRWRDLLIWQAGEVVYVAAVWLYLGGWLYGGIGQQAPAYDAAILVRMAAEVFLMAVVVRDVLRPAHDPVRARGSGDLDPVDVGGGVADPQRHLVADGRHG